MDRCKPDMIKCGYCSSMFLLSNYMEFLNHKLTSCIKIEVGKNNENNIYNESYSCIHCDYVNLSAHEFLNHIEQYHHIKLLKKTMVEKSIQIEDYEEINFNINIDNEFNYVDMINNNVTIVEPKIKKRERCCLEDPDNGYCDENTACPLLIESSNDMNAQDSSIVQDTEINILDSSSESNSLTFPPQNVPTKTVSSSTTTKYYFCDQCNRKFHQKIHLKKHQLSQHENHRPYSCTFSSCNYSTVEKAHLRAHMRTHTGEKPFQCPVCKDYRTTQNCALAVHMRRIHPEYQLICRMACRKTFVTQHTLIRHEQICGRKK